MAFSPFDIFRRNQKIFMSVIVIGVMFMFVLSFGRGDFFDWLPRWLGAKKSKGPVLAVIDGEKIQESETSQLRSRRSLANQYMTIAAVKALENLDKYSKDNASKVSPENRATIQGAVQAQSMMAMMMNPQMRQNPQLFQQFFPRAVSDFIAAEQKLDKLVADPNTKADDLETANAIRKLMRLSVQISSMDKHYFLNMPNRNAKDSLEYMLWLKKADQLKIHFSTADVDALIEQEFLQLKADEREKILNDMTKDRQVGITKDAIQGAIADEFRVRMAQVAVMGLPDIRATGRVGHAPFDYYEFYRNETSPAQYGILSVPVENYIARVTGEPTETELRELFNKAKNTEADPAELKPGLKKGRELKVGWVEITGKEPFYTTAATDALVKAEAAAKIAGLFTIPFGPGAIGTVASVGALKLENPALQGAYDKYRSEHNSDIESRWYRGTPSSLAFLNPVLDSSYANPQVAAATVGLAAMPLGTLGNRFAVGNGTLVSADGAERRQRLFAGLASISAPNLGGVAILTQYAGNLAATAHVTPAPVPLAAVKPQLVKETTEQLRYGLARRDSDGFQEELAKINKGEDKEKAQKEAEAYIAKFAGAGTTWNDKDGKPQLGRGLKLGGSTAYFDQHNIGDDPGLAPLNDRLSRQHAGTQNVTTFGRRFFFDIDPNTGQQTKPSVGLYVPFQYPEPNQTQFRAPPLPNDFQSQFLVWRTGEVPSEAAKDFDKARARTVEIWKRQKARELAKKAAEELAAQTANLGSNYFDVSLKLKNKEAEFRSQFAEPAARDRVEFTEINRVSKLVVDNFDIESGGASLKPFGLKATKAIPYPTQKMRDDLVANSSKPMSTSFVMVDRPENKYYVAVLMSRVEGESQGFFNTVYNPSPMAGQISSTLSGQYEAESRKQAREEALELLKAEFKYTEESQNLEKLTGSGE